MNFKPSDFFIGLMELFSIFLPGFITAFLFSQSLICAFDVKMKEPGLPTEFVFYFVTSYIGGHFIYAAGSLLFEQTLKLIGIGVITFSRSDKAMMAKAEQIMNEILNVAIGSKNEVTEKIRFTPWANTVIQLKHPESLVGARQYEADSKFFRSFIIVSLLGFFVSLNQDHAGLLRLFWVFISLFSVCLYFFRKQKTICELSRIIIIMNNSGEFASMQSRQMAD